MSESQEKNETGQEENREETTECILTAEEAKKLSSYRTGLMGLQCSASFLIALLSIGLLFVENYFGKYNYYQVGASAFIGPLFLIYLFSVSPRQGSHNLGLLYTRKQLFANFLFLAVICGLVCMLSIIFLSTHMERTVCYLVVFVCMSVFIYKRYRNINTLAIVTGMGEGMLIYFTFLHGSPYLSAIKAMFPI